MSNDEFLLYKAKKIIYALAGHETGGGDELTRAERMDNLEELLTIIERLKDESYISGVDHGRAAGYDEGRMC